MPRKINPDYPDYPKLALALMLDLKRLHWNTRVFRRGKRKGRCPYEHLRLALPRCDFWGLLQDELITAAGQAKETAPGIAA
jgi:hypothetical protein